MNVAAQIVTGFGRGNPLSVIMRNQLKLQLHYTRSGGPMDCPLFDADGSLVQEEVDNSVNVCKQPRRRYGNIEVLTVRHGCG